MQDSAVSYFFLNFKKNLARETQEINKSGRRSGSGSAEIKAEPVEFFDSMSLHLSTRLIKLARN